MMTHRIHARVGVKAPVTHLHLHAAPRSQCSGCNPQLREQNHFLSKTGLARTHVDWRQSLGMASKSPSGEEGRSEGPRARGGLLPFLLDLHPWKAQALHPTPASPQCSQRGGVESVPEVERAAAELLCTPRQLPVTSRGAWQWHPLFSLTLEQNTCPWGGGAGQLLASHEAVTNQVVPPHPIYQESLWSDDLRVSS